MAPELLNSSDGRPVDTEKADSAVSLHRSPLHITSGGIGCRPSHSVSLVLPVPTTQQCGRLGCLSWSFSPSTPPMLVLMRANILSLSPAASSRPISLRYRLAATGLTWFQSNSLLKCYACVRVSGWLAQQVKENKAVDLVLKCCNLNPSLRPSARDVVQFLNPLDDSCNS